MQWAERTLIQCSSPIVGLDHCPPSVCCCCRCRRPTERSGKLTYAAVVGAECGPGAALAVRVSIIVGSAGFLVLYLIVLADLLIGEALPTCPWPSLLLPAIHPLTSSSGAGEFFNNLLECSTPMCRV